MRYYEKVLLLQTGNLFKEKSVAAQTDSTVQRLWQHTIFTQEKKRKQTKTKGIYSNMTGQEQRLVKTQPSLELANLVCATKMNETKMRRILAGHNVDTFSTHVVALADENGLQPPEPPLIGFRQDYSVTVQAKYILRSSSLDAAFHKS